VDADVTTDPDATFRRDWEEKYSAGPGTVMKTLGLEPISASDEHVEIAMPFRSELAQGTGYFAGGILIQLADCAATILCARALAAMRWRGFPYSVQMNAHLIANISEGRAIARAQLLSSGRSLLVAETRVRDEAGKLLIVLTSTHAPGLAAR
jgi:uncharacterized protein (TIGR00369 family)